MHHLRDVRGGDDRWVPPADLVEMDPARTEPVREAQRTCLLAPSSLRAFRNHVTRFDNTTQLRGFLSARVEGGLLD